MLLLYRLITCLALAGAPLYALTVLARRPNRWREVGERFGFLPRQIGRDTAGAIWLQASSVGELQVALSLVRALQNDHVARPIVLSVTTPAARRVLEQMASPPVPSFMFPLDLPAVIGRTVDALRPSLFIAIETEIWPNLYARLRRDGVPIVIVNGRLSDRTFPRYERWASLFRRAIGTIRMVCARSPEDATRFVALGVEATRVTSTGNLKFDCMAPRPEQIAPPLRALLAERRVLVAGSTHAGEEEAALAGAQQALARGSAPVAVVLAPRHRSRLHEVAVFLDRAGVTWVRRSTLGDGHTPTPRDISGAPLLVVLLDTHGELAPLYALADVALLGGTLVPVGGHNPLEAAAAGVPSVSGPHLGNIQDTGEVLQACGGLLSAPDAEAVAAGLARLLSDPDESRRRGDAGRQALHDHAGATHRTVTLLHSLLLPQSL